jgi:ribosomal protein S18 acetylase RimI-like enzyme
MSGRAVELRSLQGLGWEPLAIAFNAAFADYAVPMSITPDGLAAMQLRRGYSAVHSFGAFAGEQLVGLVLTGLDGDRAYNSGTGVVPAHRGRGLARRLVEQVIDHVAPLARAYLLEVIDRNAPAIALYRRLGFVERRGLQCWTWAGAPSSAEPLPLGSAADLERLVASFAGDADLEPSWQNSLASLRRATEPPLVLGDERGVIVVFPGSADVPFLCVRRDARRSGLGRHLLASAAARCSRPLRLLNVDDHIDDRVDAHVDARAADLDAGRAGIAAFLTAAGATRTVRQLEMVRPLP